MIEPPRAEALLAGLLGGPVPLAVPVPEPPPPTFVPLAAPLVPVVVEPIVPVVAAPLVPVVVWRSPEEQRRIEDDYLLEQQQLAGGF